MSLRTMLFKLLVASPAVFLLAVVLGARTRDDGYRFPSYGSELERSFQGYIPLTKQTAELLRHNPSDASPQQLRALAESWCHERQAGVLRPMLPIGLDDTVHEGPKSQIFGVYCRLLSKTTALGMVEAERGKTDQAAMDLMLALHLAEVMKYNDFSSVMTCSLEQRRLLTFLKDLRIESPEIQRQMLGTLKQFELDQRPLDELASTMRRAHAENRIRHGDGPVAAGDAKRLFSPPILSVFGRGESMAIQASAREIGRQNQDPQFSELISEVQLGFSGQRKLEHLLSMIERRLDFSQSAKPR